MKKITVIISTLTFIVSMAAADTWLEGKVYKPAPKPTIGNAVPYGVIIGDVTLDNEVDISDLIALSEYVKKQKAMDVNQDGKIDFIDLEVLKNYIFPTE